MALFFGGSRVEWWKLFGFGLCVFRKNCIALTLVFSVVVLRLFSLFGLSHPFCLQWFVSNVWLGCYLAISLNVFSVE